MGEYKQMLEQLRSGEVASIEIPKEQYLQFREQLVKDEQFKHFRGEAKQGGNIVFTYLAAPRT
ncbi:hypothetical protein [Solibacillus sp. FSL H8-0538]|uniref:hypothetical protein n=1 Tax=Solibacillus sp. FSL H8-0538 TaxID=2921400 RepID=UPI0030FAC029